MQNLYNDFKKLDTLCNPNNKKFTTLNNPVKNQAIHPLIESYTLDEI